MAGYPITPEYLENAPEALVRLYQVLEASILRYICEQFKTEEANATAIELIRLLQRRGLDLDKIQRIIRETTGFTQYEIDRILNDAVKRNQEYYEGTLDKLTLLGDKTRQAGLQAEISALERQTAGEFTNITRSMGFALRGADGKVTFLPIAEAYQRILDDAEIEAWAGGASYSACVRNATKRLADSGLQYVDYESGWHNRVEVAARRAIMTGVTQISAAYSTNLAEEIGTEYVEVTAHRGARDKGTGPANHKSWQGKVYHIGGDREGYQSLERVTGYGTGEGLCGWNCRHHFHPFVPGIMERTYTDKELAEIDPPPITFEGRTYTAYEATQKQRQTETAMRQIERRIIAADAAGDTETLQTSKAKYRRLEDEYTRFCRKADLTPQRERGYIPEWGPKLEKMAKAI